MKQASIKNFFGTPAPAKTVSGTPGSAGASGPRGATPGSDGGAAKRERDEAGSARAPDGAPPPKAPALPGAPSARAAQAAAPSFYQYASPHEPPPVPSAPSAAVAPSPGGGLTAQQRLQVEANRQAALQRKAQRERGGGAHSGAHSTFAGASALSAPAAPQPRPPLAPSPPPAAPAPLATAAIPSSSGGDAAVGAAGGGGGGRRRRLVKYSERSDDEEEEGGGDDDEDDLPIKAAARRARGARAPAAGGGSGARRGSRAVAAARSGAASDSEEEAEATPSESSGSEEEEEEESEEAPRARKRKSAAKGSGGAGARAGGKGAAAPGARARGRAGARADAHDGGGGSVAAESSGGGGGGADEPCRPGASAGDSGAAGALCWEGEQPPFLKDPRDRAGRRPGEAGYDGRTLLVTEAQLARLSPGMEQYWRVKREHMDCVLCFKVGKFYELFEDDAHLCHRELELNYMGKARPHAGFPEAALPKYAEQLVARGYRLAVVEQMETPAQLAERNRLAKARDPRAKAERAVRREVCSLLSAGTLTSAQLAGPEARWLLCLTQAAPAKADPPGSVCRFGACLVDAAASRFVVGSFADGPTLCRLRTLLAEACPAEAVLDGGCVGADADLLVALAVRQRCISRAEAFPDAEQAAAELLAGDYFARGDDDGGEGGEGGGWPEVIAHFRPDAPHRPPPPPHARGAEAEGGGGVDALGMSALGGAHRYLQRLLLATELFSLGQIEPLPTPGGGGAWDGRAAAGGLGCGAAMRLDAAALANLEVLCNSSDGGRKGTLLDALDRTATLWGSRQLRGWLCRPLVDVAAIEARQQAICSLAEHASELAGCRAALRKLPDLERLLARMHALSVCRADDGATFYADVGARRVRDLVGALRGLLEMDECVRAHLLPLVASGALQGPLLAHCCSPGQGYPDGVQAALRELAAEFDWQAAAESGRVVPADGVCPPYDEAAAAEAEAEAACEAERQAVERLLGLRAGAVPFFHAGGVGKETHQLEVAEAALQRFEAASGQPLPAHWELMSSKKGARRFWTPALRQAVARLDVARQAKEAALTQEHRALFRRFASRHALWSRAVRCVGELDCLLSLAVACAAIPGLTRPKLVARGPQTGNRPLLRVRGGFHLLAAASSPGGSFVANDVALGGERDGSCGTDSQGGPEPVVALVTGPNMGGKSTLLRQTALLTLMAQLGCLVPAAHAELTPADAIYTRVGAADRILAGQSTFKVELEETSAILHGATADSLVILDELGRGTATFDGMAIAHAVLSHLTQRTGCRTLFATHYHLLAEQHEAGRAGVSVHRMGCAVDEATREVTFLYRFERGACLRSHGVNVARLAGLPAPLLASAAERSERMELHTSTARPAGAAAARTRARAAELGRQIAAAAAALEAAEEPAARESCLRSLQALQAEARELVAAPGGAQ